MSTATSSLPGVLIVTGNLDTFGTLRHHLEEDFRVLEPAVNAAGAHALVDAEAETGGVEVVLIDLDLPGRGGAKLTRELLDANPDLLPVAILSEASVEQIRRAMVAGARDYLAPPLTREGVLEVIRRTYNTRSERLAALQRSREQVGQGIWSFASASGGCGQTTLLLAIANELVAVGKRVVVVDLDWIFADVSFYLGLPPATTTVLELLEEANPTDPAILSRFLRPHDSGLQVLSEPRHAGSAAVLDAARVAEIIQALPQVADYVLLDLPTGLSDGHVPYLDASAFVFATSDGVPAGMKNLKRMVEVLLEMGYPKSKLRPVLTAFDEDAADLEFFRGILAKVDASLAYTFPADSQAADLALRTGQPLSRIDPRSPFTRAVRDFLAPILERARPPAPTTKPKTLFERLFG